MGMWKRCSGEYGYYYLQVGYEVSILFAGEWELQSAVKSEWVGVEIKTRDKIALIE